MTDTEASILSHKHPNFFTQMKFHNKNQYSYIHTLEGLNLYEHYLTYKLEQETVLKAWADSYYWLEDNKLIYQFSTLVHIAGLSTNERSFCTGASQIIFNAKSLFNSHKTYIKYIKILKLFLKFKERKLYEI